jgi:hypothetical protein
MPDIFGADYNENLNMDRSVRNGERGTWFAVEGKGKKAQKLTLAGRIKTETRREKERSEVRSAGV